LANKTLKDGNNELYRDTGLIQRKKSK
jgi:hypothetical protein